MALWPRSPSQTVSKLPPLLRSRTPLPASSETTTANGPGPVGGSPGDIRHHVTTIVDSATIHETDMSETMQGLALICTQALIDAEHEGFAEDLELAFNRWFQPAWHCEVARGHEDGAPLTSTRNSLEHYVVGTFISFTLNGWSIAIYKNC
ncbi:hypothetical protein Vafri_6964 [Volvox africanus]|uniref:Dynein light chain n=1 Tax=Volvox africanus TaxID=51714 RepID=A0A8J4F023_9CHLO|nr:hypothetical protein Vafri_6964 [Volvox africanus]